MVQILEEEDFGANIARGLGKGLQNPLQTLLQTKVQRMNEREKLKNLSSILSPSPGESSEEEIEIGPGQLIALEQQYPGSGKILQEHMKVKKAEKEKKDDLLKVEKSLANMLKVLPEVGPGKALNRLSSKGRASRQYFDSLGLNLEQIGATMVGKGVLSKPRFEFLLKNLPSSSKTQAANKGAIKAWSEILGIELPQLSSDDFLEEENVKETIELPTSKGEETLTIDKATEFLNKAKGNKELARKLARKHGFKF